KVNLKLVKPSYKLKDGDRIEIFFVENEEKSSIKLSDILVYEDSDIMIVNKPQGMLVHPTGESWMSDYLALSMDKNTLVYLIYTQTDIANSDVKRLGLVHRLDADTSGVMVIAKNLKSQNFLMEQFSSHSVYKKYIAVVSGIIREEKIVIDAPIGRVQGAKKLTVIEYGRDAYTEIFVKERGRSNSYIEVYPKTGRTNQIRVHLSYIKHPIIGDLIYGKTNYYRLMLHSNILSFIHPSKKKKVFFEILPDKTFMKSINELLFGF
ncbi:MAG: RluA family pseudouridine synthase, partial [Elusimicrobiales bacterium]|nr:RluA family pseudouridine synthase [Elusimicrobiales bacterium]